MKNFEIYEDEVKEYDGDNFCEDFVLPYILKKDDCAGIYCSDCANRQLLWFLKEYEGSEVDWNQVKVDTPMLVKEAKHKNWIRGYFAKYEDGKVYAWSGGRTSWTSHNMTTVWDYAKLVKNKKPEIDWSKVEVDTPIYW